MSRVPKSGPVTTPTTQPPTHRSAETSKSRAKGDKAATQDLLKPGRQAAAVPLEHRGTQRYGLKKPADLMKQAEKTPLKHLPKAGRTSVTGQAMLGGEEDLAPQANLGLLNTGVSVDNAGFHGARLNVTDEAKYGLGSGQTDYIARIGLGHVTGAGFGIGLLGAKIHALIGGGVDVLRVGAHSQLDTTKKLPIRVSNELDPELGVGAHAGAGASGTARLDKLTLEGQVSVRAEAGVDAGVTDFIGLKTRSGRKIIGVEGGAYGSAGAGVSGSAGGGFNPEDGAYLRFRKVGGKVGVGGKFSGGVYFNPIGIAEAAINAGLDGVRLAQSLGTRLGIG